MPSGTTLEELVASMATRFERVEQAILGDPSIGHYGLVERMARVEADHRDVPLVHQEMEKVRAAGDKRAHDHIDEIQRIVMAKIEAIEETNAADSARIEKKIDRLVWTVLGATAAILGGGSWAFIAG